MFHMLFKTKSAMRKIQAAAACCGMLQHPHQQLPESGVAALPLVLANRHQPPTANLQPPDTNRQQLFNTVSVVLGVAHVLTQWTGQPTPREGTRGLDDKMDDGPGSWW